MGRGGCTTIGAAFKGNEAFILNNNVRQMPYSMLLLFEVTHYILVVVKGFFM